jgi:hypothetical protein
MTDPPNYDDLPVKEADRLIQEQMAHHRDQLRAWRLRRGQRLQRELDAGRKPAEIAVDIDTSAQVVYDLTREARKAAEAAEQK